MKWPWYRQRLAAERVHQEVEQATAQRAASDAEVIAAHFRSIAAKQQAERSYAVTARFRKEVAKNGFTELLQLAMGRH